ncbi:MAG TPA: hypothetical protein VNN08_11305 [Thermoanaerobaculia bacterium]|nr:hypothetical protein [Thermoanaerobaculia bacterium]
MEINETQWLELPIGCPHCGNHGEPGGEWEANGWSPFKLIEEAVRSWEFTPVNDGEGLSLIADTYSETGDRRTLSLECMQCFELFPLPEKTKVQFV